MIPSKDYAKFRIKTHITEFFGVECPVCKEDFINRTTLRCHQAAQHPRKPVSDARAAYVRACIISNGKQRIGRRNGIRR